MADGLTVETLRAAAARLADAMAASKDELNRLDGELGDGDLGVTLANGFRSVQEQAGDLPDDLGMALMKCAQALTKHSGSSYSTLLATGFMAAAKEARGSTSIPWSDVAALLQSALTKMAERGKSSLGDKTVLDAVDAAREGAASASAPAEMLSAAIAAVDRKLDALRDQPCKQGRARIFSEKSVGLDDPGMVGFKRILEGLE